MNKLETLSKYLKVSSEEINILNTDEDYNYEYDGLLYLILTEEERFETFENYIEYLEQDTISTLKESFNLSTLIDLVDWNKYSEIMREKLTDRFLFDTSSVKFENFYIYIYGY